MRLILEKKEILAILEQHFDVKLDAKQVVIRTDPAFEIEVSGIPLAGRSESVPTYTSVPEEPSEEEAAKSNRVLGDEASFDPPAAGTDDIPTRNEDINPAAILARSKQIERELANDPNTAVEKRRSGRYSHEPPKSFKEEL